VMATTILKSNAVVAQGPVNYDDITRVEQERTRLIAFPT